MRKKQKTIWPNNAYYISFSLMLACFLYVALVMQVGIRLYPLPVFILFGAMTFFFMQRISIDEGHVSGPSAYNRLRRTKIPKNEIETFYVTRKWGTSYLVLRHTLSNRQIYMPSSYFSKKTIKKLHEMFPEKGK